MCCNVADDLLFLFVQHTLFSGNFTPILHWRVVPLSSLVAVVQPIRRLMSGQQDALSMVLSLEAGTPKAVNSQAHPEL